MQPGIVPLPPRRGRASPPFLVTNLILCILQATQGWQRFFEVRATPNGHRVRTNKIRTYPPIVTVYVEFFFCINECGPRSLICPFRESLLQCDPILSWFFGTMHHEWTDRECLRIVVSYTSFGVDSQCDILDHLFSFRIGDHVVDLSGCKSSEKRKGRKLTWCTSFALWYHLVRSDRTCIRRCRRPITPDMLCTVLWVHHRVVHTVQCFQLL